MKLRPGGEYHLQAKGHTADNWQNQDLSPELAVPKVRLPDHWGYCLLLHRDRQLCFHGLVSFWNVLYHLKKGPSDW